MKATILIVDDDPDILTVLKANLQMHGFETITASSCAEAEERLEQKRPDLIVLDRILPDGEGMEMCRRWSQQTRGLPIIMLTAMDTVSDRVLGLESGADDYVVKPFEPVELVARIKACLRRLKPEEGDVIVSGGLTIDPSAMSVTLRGEPVELTPKQYQLLSLLARHPGKVHSRDQIRKELWSHSKIYSWSRVIDVHIQHLRQKMERNPSEPECIITVPGTGYKFIPPEE